MDASQITYSPRDLSKWPSAPTETDAALDDLGDRAPTTITAWTDNAILRGDGTSGIQGGTLTLTDAGNIDARDATTPTGAGDSLVISAGDGGLTSGAAGSLNLFGGAVPGSSGAGGPVTIDGGTGKGSSSGGLIAITAGDADSGTAGTVNISAGTSTSGTDGSIKLIDHAGTTALEVTGIATPTVKLSRALDCNGQNINSPGNIDAKGDLMAGTAADAWARLAVGTNGWLLSADSTQSTGLRYRERIVAVRTSGLSRNTTTTLAVDGVLTAAVSANKNYRLSMVIIFDDASNGTADFKYDFSGPTGAVPILSQLPAFVGGSLLFTGTSNITTALTQAKTVDVTILLAHALVMEGILTVGANAGTLDFRWAQNTSNASNVTVQAGSFLEVIEV